MSARYLVYEIDKRQTTPYFARFPPFGILRVIVDLETEQRWYADKPIDDGDPSLRPLREEDGTWEDVGGGG